MKRNINAASSSLISSEDWMNPLNEDIDPMVRNKIAKPHVNVFTKTFLFGDFNK